ncbi:glycosyltransferase family 2 protein [Latilactobacillus curvatus]|uniref:glycosyltransferase family 2 protein n=1 Tax=Latilactobacillus curvatus TaxID=28038 RepID=UPI0023DBCEC7|nr:glycosyltransferase family 2 protein [Latilactobacillus curvatus]
MKLSIIIPVYNGEKYIKKTVSQILRQSVPDMEILLIDDGSLDRSHAVCEELAEADFRVRSFTKTNGGISNARNLGMKYAKGDYIAFADQDDEVLENAYHTLLAGYSENDIDFVISGKTMQLIGENNQILEDRDYAYPNARLSGNELFKEICNMNQNFSFAHIWNCLYRRDIIEKYHIQFDVSLKFGHEDTLFNILYGSHCKSVQTVPGLVYKYTRRAKSSTSMMENKGYIDDFSHILNVSHQALTQKLVTKELKETYYTFMLRMGLGLYRQYSIDASKTGCEQNAELKEIFQQCHSVSGTNRVTGYRELGIAYLVFLQLLSFTLHLGFIAVARDLIIFSGKRRK